MPCYHPVTAWQSFRPNANGKRPLVFKQEYGIGGTEQPVPCRRCIGCRLDYSRQWAIRCMHESSLHKNNCFLTLTFNDEYLPFDLSVSKTFLSSYMKRFRSRFGEGIRFAACGEYGTVCATCGKSEMICNRDLSHVFIASIGRPHYHVLIFNHDFNDRVLFSEREGVKLYTSEKLNSSWVDPDTQESLGFATVGDVTFESCAYVSRYITKKISGDQAYEHYQKFSDRTGEIFNVEPEFFNASRNNGIGHDWYKKYGADLDKDYLTLRGHRHRPPRYYDYLLHKDNPDFLESKKLKRKESALLNADNVTPDRLHAAEFIQNQRATRLMRSL